MIDAEQLRSILSYDPETGVFRWLVSLGRRARVGAVAGYVDKRGYRFITIRRRIYRAHRLAWLYVTGEWPVHGIDHRLGIKDDNRFSQLRDCTQRTNQENRRSARLDNKLGLLGVCRNRKKFQARLKINGKTTHIGLFDTPEEAHAAYVAAKRMAHAGCTL